MLRFESTTPEHEAKEFGKDHVLLEWEEDEENIWDILSRFKYFLLAKSYSPDLVNRIQYLTDDQYAKMKLLDEKRPLRGVAFVV